MRPARPGPAADLIALFERHGCRAVDTDILQPASLFLELSGEDIRRRLYLVADGSGGPEMCLRPEHTIPVCRLHLAGGETAGRYCYSGRVFRQRSDEPGEFDQAGFELVGDTDIANADAEVLGLAMAALAAWPERRFAVRTGDMDVAEDVLQALAVPSRLKRRLIARLASGASVDAVLDSPAGGDARAEYAGLLAAIEGQDPAAARRFVEDVMAIAGITTVGARSPGEIAERFLARANGTAGLGDEARAVLRAFLGLETSLAAAPDAVEDLARDVGLDIAPVVETMRRRVDILSGRDILSDTVRFAGNFARNFDYYTGFVFDIREAGRPDAPVVAGGGRYDRLFGHLGSPAPVPAIGCSFWLDRLGAHR